jgi:hypothetical protein
MFRTYKEAQSFFIKTIHEVFEKGKQKHEYKKDKRIKKKNIKNV